MSRWPCFTFYSFMFTYFFCSVTSINRFVTDHHPMTLKQYLNHLTLIQKYPPLVGQQHHRLMWLHTCCCGPPNWLQRANIAIGQKVDVTTLLLATTTHLGSELIAWRLDYSGFLEWKPAAIFYHAHQWRIFRMCMCERGRSRGPMGRKSPGEGLGDEVPPEVEVQFC